MKKVDQLPDCKILVNKVLSPSVFANYLSLKDTAKKLGFKFVWYCNDSGAMLGKGTGSSG